MITRDEVSANLAEDLDILLDKNVFLARMAGLDAGIDASLGWIEHAKQEYSSIPGVESVLETVIQNVRGNLL